MKVLKAPEARTELASSPETMLKLKPLIQAAGLAA
jgi:hypothetical protein